jgi:hypothetical protein
MSDAGTTPAGGIVVGDRGSSHIDVGLTPADEDALRNAVRLLENPSLIARLSDLAGTPIEAIVDRLPEGAGSRIEIAVRASLEGALKLALTTMRREPSRRTRNRLHTAAAGLSGALGGAFGLASLAVELPVTTTVILRSVADVARSEGEDLAAVSARLACLEVFALGGRSRRGEAAESGYFAIRAALARAVSEASRYIAQRATVSEGAPAIARLLAAVGSRFNSVVAEKILAQGVPVVGAFGGAAVNMMFIRHFQDVARGHFTVRRLERAYGSGVVRSAYESILAEGRDGAS